MKNFNILILSFLFFSQLLIAQKIKCVSISNEIELKKINESIIKSNDLSLISNRIATKISPLSESLMIDLRSKNNNIKTIKKDYRLSEVSDIIYVKGLIKISNDAEINELKKFGLKIGTKIGSIFTFRVPVQEFDNLVNSSYYDYLQVDEPVKLKMDKALKGVNADQVHLGTELSHAYKGSGVIIGILDGGFDYTHPNFYDNNMNNLRIGRVWQQNNDEGNPPDGYDFGTEFKTKDNILKALTDDNYESHGSHVAGIAAGSGNLTNGAYVGIAPESELVLVSLTYDDYDDFTTGQSSIIDAISYIFKYAESIGKPAVINLSLGTHIGPHDGSSLFDQACDALAGPGKILVGSAGNEGDVLLHISKTLTSSSNFLSTFVELEYFGDQYPSEGMIDIWANPGEEFCIYLTLYDYENVEIKKSEEYCTNINGALQKTLSGSDGNLKISIFATNSDFNSKPRIFLNLNNASSDLVILTVTSNEAKINMWNQGLGSGLNFSSAGMKDFTNGDNSITIGEIGGTGKSIITVGAYSSKNTYTSINGGKFETGFQINNLVDYSSRGPTVDGRLKPEITAPGSAIVSSVNSYDNLMIPNGPYRDYVITEVTVNGTHNWPFAAFEGTSMASPVVAGVVALMLEYYPTLTPEQIKNALKLSAITDSYTGFIPPQGSFDWGWGKVNALNAMKMIPTNIDESVSKDEFSLFPNPNNGVFLINYSNEEPINLAVFDILGNEIINIEKYTSGGIVNLENYPHGVYLVKLIQKNNVFNKKVIINN